MVETWEQFDDWLNGVQTAVQSSDFRRVDQFLHEAPQHIRRLEDVPLSPTTKQRVLDTYRRLTLMVSAHQQEVENQMTRLHSGKRALGGYRVNH